jgi:hypothetical protein
MSDGRATRYDWTVEQGELVTLRIPVLDSFVSPFDVTGWSVDAKIKSSSDSDATIIYAFAPGGYVASGTNVYLTILPNTSLAWSFQRAWYRVKVIHPTDSTNIQRVLNGTFLLIPD